jgi:hypothetical protein
MTHLIVVLQHHDSGLETIPKHEVSAEHEHSWAVDRQSQHKKGASSTPVVMLDPPAFNVTAINHKNILTQGHCHIEIAQPGEIELNT